MPGKARETYVPRFNAGIKVSSSAAASLRFILAVRPTRGAWEARYQCNSVHWVEGRASRRQQCVRRDRETDAAAPSRHAGRSQPRTRGAAAARLQPSMLSLYEFVV